MLLSDAKLAAELDSRFVLSWESVRAVPKATIDFGNGEVVTRTLKGNTVFYVCTPDGRVQDILPGVYTPDDFRKELGPDPRRLAQLQAEDRLAMLSKCVVESPILSAFELTKPGTHLSELNVRDISSEPHTTRQLEQEIGQPAGLKPDSQASIKVLRPAAKQLLLKLTAEQRKSPASLTETVYLKLLGIDLQDPYLGLLGGNFPGVD